MNHTPNYQLSQWEASDPVQRADFNADNAKIEAAILASQKAPCCIHGTYVGNGGTVTVNVGFRPSFIAVIPDDFPESQISNVVLLIGGPGRQVLVHRSGVGTTNIVTFTDNGFQITDPNTKTGFTTANLTFYYYAFY